MDENKFATTVTIFGQEFRVKGPQDSDYVHSVARLVDDRMREVADRQRITSPSRAAILASLNIADELLRERHNHDHWQVSVEERSEDLRQILAAAMEVGPGFSKPDGMGGRR